MHKALKYIFIVEINEFNMYKRNGGLQYSI